MAIVQMTSFSLMMPKTKKEALLQAFQRFGDVHVKALTPDKDNFLHSLPVENVEQMQQQRDSIRQYIAEIERFEKANRWLVSAKERTQLMKRELNVNTMTFEELEQRAEQIDIESLLSSMDEAGALHEGEDQGKGFYYIEPWKNTKLKDRILVEIRDNKPIIGTVAAEFEHGFVQDIRNAGHIFCVVRKFDDENVLFVLKPSKDQLETAEIFAQKYHMKRRSAQSVQMNHEVLAVGQMIDRMIRRRNRTDGSLEKIAQRKQDLMIYYEYLENMLFRAEEQKKFVNTDSMLIVSGWVPSASKERFASAVEGICDNQCILKLEDVPRNNPEAPVKLKNGKFTSAFETVTQMYSTPHYNEVDPTPVFTPFYILFFGMMLADVGYGLMILIISFLALMLFKLKPGTKKVARFLLAVSFSTSVWGAIYGSFFGGIVPMTPLINPNTEFTRVLIMSIIFGIVHLLVGLGIKAYLFIRDGYPIYALFDVGFWYMVLIGGIGLAAQAIVPALAQAQTVLAVIAIIGMLGIFLTNGRGARTIFGKLASGLYSLYGLTNYISDIVSYSRLMALGLAGGSIGIAINMIVRMVSSKGIIGILAGTVIFIGAHLFNLFISGLSAYVHSSRLIYVEFFSKFFTGGGTQFRPFRAKGTYINIV